jgi:hypothetical protein
MKIKLKKKTRKRLKKLGKTARRVSAALAADMIAEVVAALARRGTDITDRIEQRLGATTADPAGEKHDARTHAREADAEREVEHALPRTADHN